MYLEGENVNPPSVLPDELLERMLATIASPFPDQGAEANASVHQAVRTFVPSREALRTAVDSVFWAMQSREEARPAITRVAFQFMRDPACAVEATDLSVAELTKLSPIMDLPASWRKAQRAVVGVAGCVGKHEAARPGRATGAWVRSTRGGGGTRAIRSHRTAARA